MTPTPAAWFKDPSGSDRQRYWDGTAWTDSYAPGLPPSAALSHHLPFAEPPTAPVDDDVDRVGKGRKLVVAGVITSAASLLLCPILGSLAGGGLAFAGQRAAPAGRRSSLTGLAVVAYALSVLGILGWGTAVAVTDAAKPAEQRVATKPAVATMRSPPDLGPATTGAAPATTLPVPVPLPSYPEQLIAALRLAPENDPGAYDRDAFAYPDGGTDDRGCNTRARVLQRDSIVPAQVVYPGCKVRAGQWVDATTGTTYTDPADVSIDHLVPLKEAYRSGASSWSASTLAAFGNDVGRTEALKVIGGSGNASKGDKDPARWKPPLRTAWPEYARAWFVVKVAYDLTAGRGGCTAFHAGPAIDAGYGAVPARPGDPSAAGSNRSADHAAAGHNPAAGHHSSDKAAITVLPPLLHGSVPPAQCLGR